MAYNQNFYSFRNDFTFQNNLQTFVRSPFVPPPPPPPLYFISPMHAPNTDQEYIERFEVNSPLMVKRKPKLAISQVCTEIRNIVLAIDNLKKEEEMLSQNINLLSNEDWESSMKVIEKEKNKINEFMHKMNNSHLDLLRRVITKRSAKRMRLKRLRLERKREKEDMIKEAKDRSRKIDENLQKIKDGINKIKQEEEAKLQADAVLKEVLRKKSDAKKCLTKLDALLKLRKARENTAKGMGVNVSESDAMAFNLNIGKLKNLWTERLAAYNKEEAELRDKLKEDTRELPSGSDQREEEIMATLNAWKKCLFGGNIPQKDFRGDLGRFLAARSQWDQFVSSEGSPLPVGWVLPSIKSS